MTTITLASNEECLIKQTINNTSEVPINYSLSSTGNNYEIKLVDDTTNTALGSLESSAEDKTYTLDEMKDKFNSKDKILLFSLAVKLPDPPTKVTTTGGTIKKENFGYTKYESTSSNEIKYIMDYLTGTRNYNISMGTAFENFQTGPLLNYLSNLKSGDWCLGNVGYVSSTDNSLPLTIQELKDKQNNSSSFYYDTYVRLYGKSLKESTLKSIGTNINKFGDNTDMYVGTLAADEAVYADGKIYSGVTSDNIYYY